MFREYHLQNISRQLAESFMCWKSLGAVSSSESYCTSCFAFFGPLLIKLYLVNFICTLRIASLISFSSLLSSQNKECTSRNQTAVFELTVYRLKIFDHKQHSASFAYTKYFGIRFLLIIRFCTFNYYSTYGWCGWVCAGSGEQMYTGSKIALRWASWVFFSKNWNLLPDV